MILIATPTYDDALRSGIATRLLEEARHENAPAFSVLSKTSSLLAYACNWLWCAGLNNRSVLTHFLMLHADVLPEAGFLGKIVAVMEQENADIVSVALPIKDEKGLTSTALQASAHAAPLVGKRNFTRRRVTLKELFELPETFDARTLAAFWGCSTRRPALLANTGCMLVNLRGDWCTRVHFEIRDAVSLGDDGQFVPDVFPEDWNFTLQAHLLGARVVVTRAVNCLHGGRMNYHNKNEWGTWAKDEVSV